jgi:formylglycine-generating enzyme required for sulfatase activity
MVYIQGGSFQMGSPESESGRDDDEGPVHTVDLDGFLMGKFEVTQEQYQAIMGTNPSNFKGATNPVEQVSWEDAQDFCRKISSKTGRTFRLPTEAEWEFACRAGSRTRFCFGDSDGGLGDYAWYDGNSGSTTHPVGGKKPNDWGLYDMHGNVWEWCSDWFGSYSSGTQRNPTGASSGSDRVFRGGSWNYSARDCRSAYRGRSEPGDRDNILGLRLSCPAVR